MTAADRPSVTDNARPPVDGFLDWLIRMDEPRNEDRRTVTLTQIIAKAAEVRGAAGRAETITATDEDAVEAAARVLYESGTGFKLTKGKPWEELTDSSRNSQRRLAQALADAGLLATARTRPAETTTEWGARHSTGEVCRHDTESDARGCVRDGGTGKRVVRREVTAWTEVDQ